MGPRGCSPCAPFRDVMNKLLLVATTGALALAVAGCNGAGDRQPDTPAETAAAVAVESPAITESTASEAAANASTEALERAGAPIGH